MLGIVGMTRVVDVTKPSETGVVAVIRAHEDFPEKPTTLVTVFRNCLPGQAQTSLLEIAFDDTAFATSDGLRIGVLETQVREVLGEPNREARGDGNTRLLLYTSGIAFVVGDSEGQSKVKVITVRRPNCLEEEPCQ